MPAQGIGALEHRAVPGQGVDEAFEVVHRHRVVAVGVEAAGAREEREPPLEVRFHSGLHQQTSTSPLTWVHYQSRVTVQEKYWGTLNTSAAKKDH